MHNLITERKYDSDVAGVRADESRARLNAGKRDGVFYFASSWNLFRVNPILFWTNSMVIDYVKEKIFHITKYMIRNCQMMMEKLYMNLELDVGAVY